MNSTSEIFASNFKKITDNLSKKGYKSQIEIARKLGLSQKTISNIRAQLAQGRDIKLATVQTIADSLKIEVWKLFIPDIPIDELMGKNIDKIVYNYMKTDNKGREFINHISEREADYKQHQDRK